MNTNGFSTGFTGLALLIGAGLGAVAAFLLMPQSGPESREQLRGYARRTEEHVHEAANKANQVFEKVVDTGRGILRG